MPALIKCLFVTIVCATFWLNPVAAQQHETHDNSQSHESHTEEKFDAGEFVIEHVLDAYEWHIA
ncbi:MAG: hypothetical protein ACOCU7_03670, partial [Tangfeifania sp.]